MPRTHHLARLTQLPDPDERGGPATAIGSDTQAEAGGDGQATVLPIVESDVVLAPETALARATPGPDAAARYAFRLEDVGHRVAPAAPQRVVTSQFDTVALSAPAPMSVPLPTDERFTEQFYLLNTAPGERDLHLFAGPTGTAVWEEFTGAGVHVGIIDDGIDFDHPDLDDNYDATRETVSGFHPDSADAHGTAVAGIIAAENNGTGTVGVAWDAQITMMAAISRAPNIEFAASFQNAVNFDVVNNSWGYPDPWFDQPYNAVVAADYAAFDDISLNGRGGLGTVFVKSAGNGRASSDNANFSGLNSSAWSVTVAAVDRDGFVSAYSTEGACLLVSAFGTPGEVVTTDRTGAAGYDAGDYTSTFNGTSAAAPMVTGVVALMLQANPELGYRDVSAILALTARHIGSAIGDAPAGHERYAWQWSEGTHWNGRGMHFSEDYGFGLVDALAAVRLAESWTQQSTRANVVEQAHTSSSLTEPLAIPDNDPEGLSITFSMASGVHIEQMRLDLGLRHTWTGDLVVTLTSPSGTVSHLLRGNGGNVDVPNNGVFDVVLTSNMFRGEDSGGTWTLQVVDQVSGDTGKLAAASLVAIGRSSVDDIYVMTEEASEYAVPATITDNDGGIDTLNASAVFSASRIALDGSASLIDGRTITLAGIENASGGDGEDTLLGGADTNALRGYRGDDLLVGNAGDDTLVGGAGSDELHGDAGDDTYTVATGDTVVEDPNMGYDTVLSAVDWKLDGNLERLQLTGAADVDGTGNARANTLVGNSGDNSLNGGLGNDTLAGGAGFDTLTGGGGDDMLNGSAGVDTLAGGAGNDTYAVDTTTDVITEDAAGGLDTVQSNVTFSLAALGELENLTLTGTGAVDATGNALDNVLTGNVQRNVLNGGAGTDTLIGGAGNDIYLVDSTTDLIIEAAGAGIDRVGSGVSFSLAGIANVEELNLTGAASIDGTGNELANTLYANRGNNVLDGGPGRDTVSYQNATGPVTLSLLLAGAQATGASGSDTLLNVENLNGSAFDDALTGSGASNTLRGLGGDDSLVGGGGFDLLLGGAGADTLSGGAGSDTFDFDALAELGSGPGADVVADFSSAQGDRLDLSTIDWDPVATGNQAFALVTDFSTAGGELRFSAGTLYFNTDADLDAEFEIILAGVPALSASDLIL